VSTRRQIARALGALLCSACAHQPTARPVPVLVPESVPVPTIAPQQATVAEELQRLADSLVALPQFSTANWGMLVVSPDRGDTLVRINADKLVMPASNQKIVTGAVAMARLGSGYRWRTAFIRSGAIVRGELRGDLIVAGTGDPSISTAMRGDPMTAFEPLVDALKRAGVTRIRGRVRSADSAAFPGSPLGFGWDWDDLDAPYGSGISELLFNDGFTDVTVRGCVAARRAACVVTAPLSAWPVIHAQVTTRAAGTGAPQVSWWRDSQSTPGITVRGSIALGDSLSFSAAQPDTRAAYIAAVTAALTRAGIAVRGISAPTALRDTIAVLESPPLSEVLAALEKPSQNQMAEALFRTLGLHGTGVGTADSGRAIVERQLAAWGVPANAYAVRDGSGLSRHNYISPKALVLILDAAKRASTFRAFHDALPMMGQEGTVRNRLRDIANGRVRAKTGTVDKARALSGYLTTRDGEVLIFSLIANNHTAPNRDVDRVQDLIVTRLLALQRGVR
jgi:serine-type D-Ala-D-Ala carboxypeptidase/endopeptidase (penicillin-binding protein 4)